MARPIYEIAAHIREDLKNQGKSINYAAAPYLEAMESLDGIDGMYFQDSARDIVQRFLGNAGSYRGDVAKVIKVELKELVKR